MHTHRGTAGTVIAINAQTVATTGTVYSDWYDASSGESYNVWPTLSGTGTPDVNLFFDISPLSAKTLSTSSTTVSYIAHKLADAMGATEGALLGPYNAANNADNKTYMDYPFLAWRIRLVGDGSNPSDTVVTVYVTRFN